MIECIEVVLSLVRAFNIYIHLYIYIYIYTRISYVTAISRNADFGGRVRFLEE